MTEEELIEQLADKEHASWARWMDYLFSLCKLVDTNDGDTYLIPAARVKHWQREIDTPYADLSERERQYDRDEVAHILPIIREFAAPPAKPLLMWYPVCPRCGERYNPTVGKGACH